MRGMLVLAVLSAESRYKGCFAESTVRRERDRTKECIDCPARRFRSYPALRSAAIKSNTIPCNGELL